MKKTVSLILFASMLLCLCSCSVTYREPFLDTSYVEMYPGDSVNIALLDKGNHYVTWSYGKKYLNRTSVNDYTWSFIALKPGTVNARASMSGKVNTVKFVIKDFGLEVADMEKGAYVDLNKDNTYTPSYKYTGDKDFDVSIRLTGTDNAYMRQNKLVFTGAGTAYVSYYAGMTLFRTVPVTAGYGNINEENILLVSGQTLSGYGEIEILEGNSVVVSGGEMIYKSEGQTLIRAKKDGIARILRVNTVEKYITALTPDILASNNSYAVTYGKNYIAEGAYVINNGSAGLDIGFFGTSLEIDAEGIEGYTTNYRVYIDNEPFGNLINITDGKNILASELSEGYHRIKMLKATEARFGIIGVKSITTDGTFVSLKNPRSMLIEAYGDSITAGYQTVRDVGSSEGELYPGDGSVVYAKVAADLLGANINISAVSSMGLYDTYGDTENVMREKYHGYTARNTDLLGNSVPKWDYISAVPDLILINMGTNDCWAAGSGFDIEEYKDNMRGFIEDLRRECGTTVPVIICAGGMTTALNEASLELAEEMTNVYCFIHIIAAINHPNQYENAVNGYRLSKVMENILYRQSSVTQ